MSFASSLALDQEGSVAYTNGEQAGYEVALLAQQGSTGNKLDEHPTYKRNLFLLLMHSHVLPFKERTSQVASTHIS